MCIQPLDGSSFCPIILDRRLFVLYLVVHEATFLCCGQWWVYSSQMNSRWHSLLDILWDMHTRAHTHIHTHAHTPHTHTAAENRVTFSSIYQHLQTTAWFTSIREHGIWHVHHQGVILWMVQHNSPPLHFSQQFTKNVNSSYRDCCTDCEEPCAWLPCSPYSTPLDFYLCGYKGVGVTGSQA